MTSLALRVFAVMCIGSAACASVGGLMAGRRNICMCAVVGLVAAVSAMATSRKAQ